MRATTMRDCMLGSLDRSIDTHPLFAENSGGTIAVDRRCTEAVVGTEGNS